VKLRKGTKVTAITTGCVHVLARTSSGRVLAWGENIDRALGNGTTTSSGTPVRVKLPAGRAAPFAIAAGPESDISLAIVPAA
jgi:alpha-tubulin suppressor-like RCC1 family protein